MKRLALYIAMFGMPMAPASAEQLLAAIQGHCLSLTVANQDASCRDLQAIVYAELGNDRTMISVPEDDGRIIAFVAETDAQPTPGSYLMYLAKVDAHTHTTHAITDVSGMCHVDMSKDTMVWVDVSCHAQDDDGRLYAFKFTGLEQPAKLIHMR